MEFVSGWYLWLFAYLQHIFVMMYWITVPGLVVAGILNVRYRRSMLDGLSRGDGGLRQTLYATGLGMTTTVSRRERLATATALIGKGMAPSSVLAYLIAGHTLWLYVPGLFMVLIGLEFGLGVFLGGLIMIVLIGVILRFLPISELEGTRLEAADRDLLPVQEPTAWEDMISSTRSWREVLKDIARAFGVLWLPSLWGLLVGTFILALDMRRLWPLPFWLGDEGFGPALASAFLGPLLSIGFFAFPLGNLVIAASIWKTWTFAYPGIISFVLASSLHPLNLGAIGRLFGRKAGWRLAITFYLSAALSALGVIGLFEIVGLEVTHVPWFEPLVKRLIMIFTGMAEMPGMMR